jgi:hypothetical protein
MAYFYKRNNIPSPVLATHKKVLLPGRLRLSESDVEVVCDPVFEMAILGAVGPLAILKSEVSELVASQLSSGRPKRERKPTKRN